MSPARSAEMEDTAPVPSAPTPVRVAPVARVAAVAPAPRFLAMPPRARPTRAQQAIVAETRKRGAAQDAHLLLGAQAVEHVARLHDEAHATFVQSAHTIRTRQARYAGSPAQEDIDRYTDEGMAMHRRHTLATVEAAAYQIVSLVEKPIYSEAEPGLWSRIKRGLS